MLALGIDRGTGSLRLALLETAGRTTRLVGCWRVPLGADADASAVLRAAVADRCPRPPDAVATALAGERVSHRILHLPFSDPGRLAATVPFELESQVPFELEDSLTTFTVLRRGPAGAEILAAIAAREDVREHLEELRSAGLDPAIVDVGGIATAGLVRLALRDALVVELRPDGGVALLKQGRLEGFHAIDGQSGTDLEGEVRWSALALSASGREEPGKVAAPSADGLPPLVVTGALSNGLPARLGTPATPLDHAVPAWATAAGPEGMRAVALAARAAGLVDLGVNFRTGEFLYHAPSEEAQKQLRITLILAAVVVLLALASFGIGVLERRAELAGLREEIQTEVAGIVPGAAPGTERVRLQGAVEGLERRLGLLGSGGERRALLDLLREITRAVPSATPFVVEEVVVDEQGVRLRGRTDTYESVDVVSRALAAIPDLGPPDVRDVKAGVDGKVELRASLPFEKEPAR
jgi:general secretion pathway protein L